MKDKLSLEFERIQKWDAIGDQLYAAHEALVRASVLTANFCGKGSKEARAIEKVIRELDAARNTAEDRVAAEGFFNLPTCSPIRGAHRRENHLACEKCAA
jgi:hypothetical protein